MAIKIVISGPDPKTTSPLHIAALRKCEEELRKVLVFITFKNHVKYEWLRNGKSIDGEFALRCVPTGEIVFSRPIGYLENCRPGELVNEVAAEFRRSKKEGGK